jgi:hypothetical protein
MARALRWTAAGVALLLVGSGRAADPQKVQQAVDRGVAYLKGLQQGDGAWAFGASDLTQDVAGPNVGATALAGLALLECGVPADDPQVQKAAGVVRGAAPGLAMTYAVSLSLLFLDRLRDVADEVLIDSLAVRLLAGQDPSTGGWTYDCPSLPEREVKRLRTLLGHRRELVATGKLPETPKGRRQVKDLPKEIQAQLQQINRAGGGGLSFRHVDNSNTQFAVLALWVARRQGIPVEAALQRVEKRFRATQNADGGWSYLASQAGMPGRPLLAGSTPSMTCAGLLGLALARGGRLEAQLHTRGGPAGAGRPAAEPTKDQQVQRGLHYLAVRLGQVEEWAGMPGPMADRRPGAGRAGHHGGRRGFGPPPMRAAAPGRGDGNLYYALWSLERVAVAYDLKAIGTKDWYDWGATVLLDNQARDGSWTGGYSSGGCDTSFALLFLRQANLARDLTAVLRGRVTDPAEHMLRSGTIAGAGPSLGKQLYPGRAPERREKPLAPPADTGRSYAGADRLAAELIGAEGSKQTEVLERLREGKGQVYTEALVLAIAKLTGAARDKARDALADRLRRRSAATLAEYLRHDAAEVRRAAALASALKGERSHVPRLIELLGDPQPPVAQAAHAALESLTKEDFGPRLGADKADVAEAVLRWQKWWRESGAK